MFFFRSGLMAVVFSLGVLVSVQAAPQKVSAPDGCPTLNHVPLVTVVRGDPALVVAQVACEKGEVLTVRVFVRLADAGKPTSIDMERQGDGSYQAVIPIALVRGINRFWYYIDARGKTTPDQEEEGVAQTRWNPVNIVDAATDSGGAGGGGAGGGGKKALYWLLGGAGLVGGAVILENHNDNGGGGSGNPPPSTLSPTTNQRDDDEEEEEEEDEDEETSRPTPTPTPKLKNVKKEDPNPIPVPPGPPPCVLTGQEGYFVPDGTACDTNELIGINVCRACPNALVEVITSWGAFASVAGWNDDSCEGTAVSLPQPPGVPSVSVGQFSISIRLNGQLFTTVPWPGASYFDCF